MEATQEEDCHSYCGSSSSVLCEDGSDDAAASRTPLPFDLNMPPPEEELDMAAVADQMGFRNMDFDLTGKQLLKWDSGNVGARAALPCTCEAGITWMGGLRASPTTPAQPEAEGEKLSSDTRTQGETRHAHDSHAHAAASCGCPRETLISANCDPLFAIPFLYPPELGGHDPRRCGSKSPSRRDEAKCHLTQKPHQPS
uniref:Uncharacterized protein n=1 Tax=Oryza rufipogon TaxID=4529 RepID=A0A0E0Q1Y3_ORYRU